MSLKDRIQRKNAGLVKRETHTLPDAQETVQICGLMLGERSRVGEKTGFAQVATMIALGLEDPDTGERIYNANDLDDHNQIATFSGPDSDLIVDTIMRLSGMDKKSKDEAGKESAEIGNSSSFSSPELVYLPPDSPAS